MSVTSSGGSPNSINMRVCLARVIHSQSDEILIRWIAFLLFWHSNSWREIQTILIQLAKYQVVLKSDETLKHASEVPSFTFNSRPDARWQELEGWCANRLRDFLHNTLHPLNKCYQTEHLGVWTALGVSSREMFFSLSRTRLLLCCSLCGDNKSLPLKRVWKVKSKTSKSPQRSSERYLSPENTLVSRTIFDAYCFFCGEEAVWIPSLTDYCQKM